MSASITPYTNLITSEHNQKPKFLAWLSALVQGPADISALEASLISLYDLDTAVGVQLDTVGQWVGRSRYLSVPLTGVYFSFDTVGVGFDQGTWQGPYDPTSGLVALPDDAYRTLLRAVIVANTWDGTIPGAYAAWAVVFAGQDAQVIIQDNDDMSMLLGLLGATPTAVVYALFTGGYIQLKPAGVHISGYATPSVPDTPLFGFDVQNSSISGFDTGAWATIVPN